MMLMVVCASTVSAQVTVTGQVLDENNQPVIGASILVKGTSKGAATDVDGRFTVQAPSRESVLKVTFIGYQPQEVPAASAGTIVLKPMAENLDEVVVITITPLLAREP